ncbi:MAG: hypothetical protein U7M05_10840 [Candidatus Igneacidithiobacillus chanchocoensis]
MTFISMSIAPKQARQDHLLRPASLLLFILVVLAVVFAVAWQYGWHGRLAFQESAADAQAQIEGARLMLRSGQYRGAERQLQPLLCNSAHPKYRDARILQWQIAMTEAMAQKSGSPARAHALYALRPMLRSLYTLGPWSAAQWRDFAHDAFAIGAYSLSAQAWMEAAQADPDRALADRKAAADAWAAGGDPVRGGQILLDLAVQSRDPDQAESLLVEGLRWIEGGAGAKAALVAGQAAMQRHPEWWQKRDLVLLLAHLALSAGRPKLAAQWLHAELLRGTARNKS